MNLSTYSVMSMIRRSEFSGRNDVYARGYGRTVQETEIQLALRGEAPFDVTGQLFSPNARDAAIQRLARYRNSWNFYNGEHWTSPFEDGDRKPVFNYCGTVADKAAEWYVAKGVTFRSPRGNEDIAQLLNEVWKHNFIYTLLQKMALYGSVTGDAFLYVTINTVDALGKKLPKSEWTVSLNPIDPQYVYPLWSESSPNEMDACVMQFPLTAEANPDESLYTIFIERDKITTWKGTRKTGEVDNKFGKVNVVYYPNLIVPNSLFGVSDIERIIPVNEEYNTVANSIRKIIKYQGEPTTLVYGARVSQLERSANSVWSNLPIDAKVENLKLDTDLKANFDYLDRLEKQIYKLSSTPAVAFEAQGVPVSNTSGLAMQMLYQPLIEKTVRRQQGHIRSYVQTNELILLAYENYLGVDIKQLADYPADVYKTDVQFSSPLPKDEPADLDLGMKKIAAGIWSKAEAIRQLSGVTDQSRLLLELAADKRAELVTAYESANAANGIAPNMSSVFLSSPFLQEDLQTLAAPNDPNGTQTGGDAQA